MPLETALGIMSSFSIALLVFEGLSDFRHQLGL